MSYVVAPAIAAGVARAVARSNLLGFIGVTFEVVASSTGLAIAVPPLSAMKQCGGPLCHQ